MLGKRRGSGTRRSPRHAVENSVCIDDSGAGDNAGVEEKDVEKNRIGGGLILDGEMGDENLVENKCDIDSGTAEWRNDPDAEADADLTCVNSNKEQRQPMSKRRCRKEKAKASTPLRRSARQAAILGSPLDSSNDVVESHSSEKLCAFEDDASVDQCSENDFGGGGVLELPPSSENLNLQNLPVSDFFCVYSFLRSFSTFLFLSPFTMEAFVESLSCEFPNSLIDSVHFSILQILKVHLEHLSEEGNQFASNCLRGLNWRLLDTRCWPIYLAEYLLYHSSSMKPCLKLAQLTILNQGYYKLSADIKLDILQFLCDDVVEIDLMRSEIRRRVLNTELDLDNDQNIPYQYSNKDFTPNDLESSPSLSTDRDIVDPNHDECCICKMDGNLICCDGCPAAFHSRCLGVPKESLPEGDWYCPECLMGKVDRSVKPSKAFAAFHGAELLGIDVHGYIFFGCYGYLLVSDSHGVDFYNYYNKGNLNLVIEALMASSCTLYTDIIIAIKKYWSIPDDSACSVYDDCGHNGSNCDTSLICAPLSPVKEDSTIQKSNLKNCAPQGCIDSTLSKFNSLYPESFIENPQSTKIHIDGADSSIRSTIYAKKEELQFEIDEEMKNGRSQMQSKPNGYINSYFFGHISSSIASEITSMSPENNSEGLKNSVEDTSNTTMSSQLSIISKNVLSFDWSVFQKLSLDAHKERCGWCFSCQSSDNKDCLLYIIENKFLESPEYLSVGLCTMDNKKNHMDSVVHSCLVIEDNLQGLLSGPWEDPCYRKHWRKCILEASNIESIKKLLFTLESNVRQIMFSNEWLKPVDRELTVGSACHVLTSFLPISSKKLDGRKVRKRAKKSTSERKKNNVVGADSDIFWWRGGKISRQLFNWKRLPISLTVRCGRQAGCKRIHSIYYPDGSEVAKRKKYIAWRVAVETSKTAEQLITHVKDFHSNIKWNDFKNTQIFSCLAKEYIKQVRPLRNVKIRKKCVEGKQVNYVLDFGKKKNIPDIITKQAIKHDEISNGNKYFWLNETIVPLGLVKAYELKKVEQKNSKLNKKDVYHEVDKYEITKRRKRSDGFSYLFSKALKNESHKCGQCKKDIPKWDSVICEFCGGYFHKKHFTLPKGTTDIMYMCRLCENTRTTKILKSEEKVKVPVNFKANKKGSSSKLTDRQKVNVSKLRSEKLKDKAVVKLKTNGRIKHDKKAKGAASANLMNLPSGKKIPAAKNKAAIKSERLRKMQADKFKDMINVFWCTNTRTPIHPAYWLNGVLWAKKNDCKRGLDFRLTKVLMPLSQTTLPQIEPTCILCREKKYNPNLIYLSCEKCGVWVHGASFGINIESIKRINGFRCHKCRCKCLPVCLYLAGPSQVEPLDKNNSGKAVVDDIDTQKDSKLFIGEYTEQDFLHSDYNLEEQMTEAATVVDIDNAGSRQVEPLDKSNAEKAVIDDIDLQKDSKLISGEYAEQDFMHTDCNLEEEQMTEAATAVDINNAGSRQVEPLDKSNDEKAVIDDINLQKDSKPISGEYAEQDVMHIDCNLEEEQMTEATAMDVNNAGSKHDVPLGKNNTEKTVIVDTDPQEDSKLISEEYAEQDFSHLNSNLEDEMTEATAVDLTDIYLNYDEKTLINEYAEQESQQIHNKESVDCGMMVEETAKIDFLGDNGNSAKYHHSAANAVDDEITHLECLAGNTQLQGPKDLNQGLLQSQCRLLSQVDPSNVASASNSVDASGVFVRLVDDTQHQCPKDFKP